MTDFKTANQPGVIVQVNTPVTADIAMEVGQTNEVVNIAGGAERLQTDNATIGNVVQQKAIESLPLNGRNPLTLITLEPGVVQRSFGGIGSGIHVNGSRDRAYNVTIDGIEANEDRKSTRLNSSHLGISYAVFCLKKRTIRSPWPRRSPRCGWPGRAPWRCRRRPLSWSASDSALSTSPTFRPTADPTSFRWIALRA